MVLGIGNARGVALHTAPLVRGISPGPDLRAIWNLRRFFLRERFDLVEVSTPKAAMVGALAARMADVPCLVHLVRGLLYPTRSGLAGRVMRWSEMVPCRLAHRVISVSPSVREQLDHDGLYDGDRMLVLGQGSSNGVDLERYSPSRRSQASGLKERCGIPPDALVVGFVGRLTAEKGVAELAEAFSALQAELRNTYLLILGDYEHRDLPPQHVVRALACDPRVKILGWQDDTAPYYGIMDVLVLPTYREGFPNAVLEASASGVAVVGTSALGCRDAVVDGETGLLVPPRDADSLAGAMVRLCQDTDLRLRLGKKGRKWAEEHFDRRRIWALYEQEYRRLVGR